MFLASIQVNIAPTSLSDNFVLAVAIPTESSTSQLCDSQSSRLVSCVIGLEDEWWPCLPRLAFPSSWSHTKIWAMPSAQRQTWHALCWANNRQSLPADHWVGEQDWGRLPPLQVRSSFACYWHWRHRRRSYCSCSCGLQGFMCMMETEQQ